ncbi:MAG: CsbD family protein [Chloroflexia bacterium]|nr:CsbD family protein [Chloroflexia bacterium]
MSNRDPLSSTPFSDANDPFTPVGDETLPPRSDAPGTSMGGGTGQSGNQGSGGITGKAQDKAGQAQEKAGEVAGKAQDKAGEVAGKAQQKASEVGEMAHSKADSGLDSAASGLGQAADMLRQQGEQRQGTVGTAAAKTADSLESASSYLREKDTDQLMTDLEALVRQKPVESVLVAVGIGFVLSKIFS